MIRIFQAINNLKQASADIKTALTAQGIEISDNTKLSDCAKLIGGMQSEQAQVIQRVKSTLGTTDEDKLAEFKSTSDKVEEFGGFNQKTVQSDKLGFDWREEYLGEKLLKQVYVPQENPSGVADNPIDLSEGTYLIPNAYYNYNGKRYVYMGENGVFGIDSSVSEEEKFVEF